MPRDLELLTLDTLTESKTFRAAEFGAMGGDWSITQSRLHGGLRDGVETLEVNSGSLRFVVVPTRGLGIWKAWRGNLEIGWKSPVRGPVHPAFVDLGEPSGLGWLDGFDELVVRCGWESNGAPEFDAETGRLKYPLHGRIANKPAQEVSLAYDQEKDLILIRGVVEETRFHFTKLRMRTVIATQPGSSQIIIRDEIENYSGSPAEVQMLYHINFGLPLLDGGSRLLAPVKTLVPRNAHAASYLKTWDSYSAPQPGFEEQVYFMHLHGDAAQRTRTTLVNSQGTQGASLLFNTQQLPCFSLWKNTTGEHDGYVTGLEPGTNFPNPRSFEGKQGRTVKLAAHGKAAFEVILDIHATAAEVRQAADHVKSLAGEQPIQIFDAPQPDWCS